ncbi:MAG: hypothetical protein LBQ24_01720 [Candidatus Peribacteria bacterium]|nr:hypothetical protein [Candidatus Peribacteria bacterium]
MVLSYNSKVFKSNLDKSFHQETKFATFFIFWFGIIESGEIKRFALKNLNLAFFIFEVALSKF